MTALLEAKQMYARLGLNFERDLGFYLTNGVVFSLPDRFLMAKQIEKDAGDDQWNPANPNCWYVHCAVGKNALRWFLDQAPVKLPFLAWRRLKNFPHNPLRIFPTEQFARFV
jgi:hypothetical protein